MVNRQNDNGVAADHSPKQQDQTEVTKTTVAETNAVVVKNGDDADKKTDLATLFATQLGIDTTSLKTKMPGKHDGEWTSMEDFQLATMVCAIIAKNKATRAAKNKTPKAKSPSEPVDWNKVATTMPGRCGALCKQRFETLIGKKNFTTKAEWTPGEDALIKQLVEKHGPKKWVEFSQQLSGRSPKQCRERWANHLSPDIIKKRDWSEEENRIIVQKHMELGNKWADISKLLVGRTDNNVKNHWNSFLIVRIETYLGNVVGIQPGKKKDTTSGRYLIPVNKLDECMTYIHKLTHKDMRGIKKEKDFKVAKTVGDTPLSLKKATGLKKRLVQRKENEAALANTNVSPAKKPSAKKARTKKERVEKVPTKKCRGKEIPSSLKYSKGTTATLILQPQQTKDKTPPLLSTPIVRRSLTPLLPLAHNQRRTNLVKPQQLTASKPVVPTITPSSLELEELRNVLSTLKGGTCGGRYRGVYVTAIERRQFAETFQASDIESMLSFLRGLHLTWEEIKRLPPVFKDRLVVPIAHRPVQCTVFPIGLRPLEAATKFQPRGMTFSAKSPCEEWKEEEMSFLHEALLSQQTPPRTVSALSGVAASSTRKRTIVTSSGGSVGAREPVVKKVQV